MKCPECLENELRKVIHLRIDMPTSEVTITKATIKKASVKILGTDYGSGHLYCSCGFTNENLIIKEI